MIVYPALDVMGGNVVRLAQGRFEQATVYPQSPEAALRSFAGAGATWAHVVDLDGARAKKPVQHELIARLARKTGVKLQVGGGFRTQSHVMQALDAGAGRVIAGTLAVADPALVNGWIEEFGPERLGIAIDVRMEKSVPMVATSGWLEESGATLWDVAGRFPKARHLLVTDISRDGMLGGPNFELLAEAARRFPCLQIQASGGVNSLGDIARLQTAGVIVGRALWEGRIRLEDALRHAGA
jgi:phosphoribosylformimino-5-aminoimidazole carboxamide ribotide isomerase